MQDCCGDFRIESLQGVLHLFRSHPLQRLHSLLRGENVNNIDGFVKRNARASVLVDVDLERLLAQLNCGVQEGHVFCVGLRRLLRLGGLAARSHLRPVPNRFNTVSITHVIANVLLLFLERVGGERRRSVCFLCSLGDRPPLAPRFTSFLSNLLEPIHSLPFIHLEQTKVDTLMLPPIRIQVVQPRRRRPRVVFPPSATRIQHADVISGSRCSRRIARHGFEEFEFWNDLVVVTSEIVLLLLPLSSPLPLLLPRSLQLSILLLLQLRQLLIKPIQV